MNYEKKDWKYFISALYDGWYFGKYSYTCKCCRPNTFKQDGSHAAGWGKATAFSEKYSEKRESYMDKRFKSNSHCFPERRCYGKEAGQNNH